MSHNFHPAEQYQVSEEEDVAFVKALMREAAVRLLPPAALLCVLGLVCWKFWP